MFFVDSVSLLGGRFQFGPGADNLGDGCDLGHGSQAHVAARQPLGLGWNQNQVVGVAGEMFGRGFQAPAVGQCRDPAMIEKQLTEVAGGQRAVPHHRVHGRRQDHRLGEIPGTEQAGQEVVAKPQGQLGQRVGVERGNDQQVGPVAKLDVQDRIAPAVSQPRPLVPVAENGIGGLFVRGLRPPGGKLAGVEEVKRGLGGDDANQVSPAREARRRARESGWPRPSPSHPGSLAPWADLSLRRV